MSHTTHHAGGSCGETDATREPSALLQRLLQVNEEATARRNGPSTPSLRRAAEDHSECWLCCEAWTLQPLLKQVTNVWSALPEGVQKVNGNIRCMVCERPWRYFTAPQADFWRAVRDERQAAKTSAEESKIADDASPLLLPLCEEAKDSSTGVSGSCSAHFSPLDLWCETCKTALCVDCISGHDHLQHEVVRFQAAATAQQLQLERLAHELTAGPRALWMDVGSAHQDDGDFDRALDQIASKIQTDIGVLQRMLTLKQRTLATQLDDARQAYDAERQLRSSAAVLQRNGQELRATVRRATQLTTGQLLEQQLVSPLYDAHQLSTHNSDHWNNSWQRLSGLSVCSIELDTVHVMKAIQAMQIERGAVSPTFSQLQLQSHILKREHLADLEGFFATLAVQKPTLLYRASRDGWLGSDFHRLCDGKGPTLVLAKAIKDGGDIVFGGFAAVEWSSFHGVVADPSAQSFVFRFAHSESITPAVKLPLRDRTRCLFVDPRSGPGFSDCIRLAYGGRAANCADANFCLSSTAFSEHEAVAATTIVGDSTDNMQHTCTVAADGSSSSPKLTATPDPTATTANLLGVASFTCAELEVFSLSAPDAI